MNFTNFIVDTVSYDWEIFPDATCRTSKCAVLPDMTLYASGSRIDGKTGQKITAADAVAQPLMIARGVAVPNYAPQNMGTLSNINVNGATGLRFQDWPAEIGIDNLVITGHAVPEPATLPLLAGGLLALGWLARSRKDTRNGRLLDCSGCRKDRHPLSRILELVRTRNQNRLAHVAYILQAAKRHRQIELVANDLEAFCYAHFAHCTESI